MKHAKVLTGILLLALLACLCWTTLFIAIFARHTAAPTPRYEVTSTPVPRDGVLPTPTEAAPKHPLVTDDIRRLLETEPPVRDRVTLAEEIHPELIPIPRVVNSVAPVYHVGDQEPFWVYDTDDDRYFRVTAQLRYIFPHVYVWVQEGTKLSGSGLKASGRRFSEKTYPTDRSYFGSEWTPGIDDDPRLVILHAAGLGKRVAGYFSSADEVSRKANPYSNEHEMFYVNPDNLRPGTSFYDGTLAHEFQHMIHWNQDRNESTWINEGCSELASKVNGFDPGGDEQMFFGEPDTQLNAWGDGGEDNTPHYGASYLLLEYSLERFGKGFVRALVAEKANGIAGYDAALKSVGYDGNFDDVFADWVVANLLDASDVGDGRYGYRGLDFYGAKATLVKRLPFTHGETVHQYATDYYRLSMSGDVSLTFTGTESVPLASFQPHSGDYVWWGYRSDESEASLVRDLDLRNVEKATLRFWAWYDIEEGYDYAYVMASADGGKSWQVLPGDHTTEENPSGNSIGAGYTGISGGRVAPRWEEEKVDLSQFAGKRIKIRFEYLTDDAVTHSGWFLDDIQVPEIGWKDDAESPGEWSSQGFVRVKSSLPQRWLVQAIVLDRKGNLRVDRIPVSGGSATEVIHVPDDGRAWLAVSAITPVTYQRSYYKLHLSALPSDSASVRNQVVARGN